jgi:soluble lytic murein transglycosylase-like protein
MRFGKLHGIHKRRLAAALLVLGLAGLALAARPGAAPPPPAGTSTDGAPDILLLSGSRPLEQLAASFQPEQRLREMRAKVLRDSIRRVLARYPHFLAPHEQRRLSRMLLDEGQRHRIDPLFLAALIRVESAFSAEAVSNKGARGLMQVMPATGAEMAQRLGLEWFGPHGLHDPEYNVRLGTYYLRRLLDRYQGSYRRALTAYNRGPRNVRFIERRYGRLQPRFTDYFRKILHIYRDYQRSLGPSGNLLQTG